MRTEGAGRASLKASHRLYPVLRICGICISRRESRRISGEAITRKENTMAGMSLGSFATVAGSLEISVIESYFLPQNYPQRKNGGNM